MRQLYFLLCGILCFSATAQDGTLDATFGNNGIAIFDNPNGDARAFDLLLNGNALTTAGFHTDDNQKIGDALRLSRDGEQDIASFGLNGYADHASLGAGSELHAIAPAGDGSYYLAGWRQAGSASNHLLVKMTADGMAATDFGTNGGVESNYCGGFGRDQINSIAIQSDGRIILAGYNYCGTDESGVLLCYNPDGSPCADFANEGGRLVEIYETYRFDPLFGMVVDDNDNIYVAGNIQQSGGPDPDSMYIMKIDPLGATDASFGTNGYVVIGTPNATDFRVGALTLDNQNRLLVGGQAYNTSNISSDWIVARVSTVDGSLDPSFGTAGIWLDAGNNNLGGIRDIVVQPSDDIIVVGTYNYGASIVRLSDGGSLENEFGTNGRATVVSTYSFNGFNAVVADGDRLYLGGYIYNNQRYQTMLAKVVNTGITSTRAPVQRLPLRVHPNPTTDALALAFEVPVATQLSLELRHPDGRVVHRQAARSVAAGTYTWALPRPAGLAAGTYFVSLRGASLAGTQRVVWLP